jgi:cytidyltransferase-like protein
MPKVFVTGCFDMLHSGHVAFFEEAATHGDLYVGIGSDRTVFDLKGRRTVNSEDERLYMIKSLKYVKDAWISSGSGFLDFKDEMTELGPDIFFTNEDGHSPEKEALCREHGIRYLVSRRVPVPGLPQRSTTALRTECRIPYRIDLAGGWLDQPYVSRFYPGPVITISIEPDVEFNDRSGMATSTRKKAIELWQHDIPAGDPELLAKTLFSFENPPGTDYVSGSQDAIGITFPGLNRLNYEKGEYWPSRIESVHDPEILGFLEDHLCMMALQPRILSFNVLDNTMIDEKGTRDLAESASACWAAILEKDLDRFGKAFRGSFDAQVAMFPNMVNPALLKELDNYKNQSLGWKLSGAGGGGYFIFVTEKPLPNAMKIRIRRRSAV